MSRENARSRQSLTPFVRTERLRDPRARTRTRDRRPRTILSHFDYSVRFDFFPSPRGPPSPLDRHRSTPFGYQKTGRPSDTTFIPDLKRRRLKFLRCHSPRPIELDNLESVSVPIGPRAAPFRLVHFVLVKIVAGSRESFAGISLAVDPDGGGARASVDAPCYTTRFHGNRFPAQK